MGHHVFEIQRVGNFLLLIHGCRYLQSKNNSWEVAEFENAHISSKMIKEACQRENIPKHSLFIHSDNGGPMKAATMINTLRRLGVMPSFSRPNVSDDNAFSEALFKTLKYRPWYPEKPFSSIQSASQWVEHFVAWYNTEHLHSGINFVTPEDRHQGRDIFILEQRKRVYEAARSKNPDRWPTMATRAWENIKVVVLKSSKEVKNRLMTKVG